MADINYYEVNGEKKTLRELANQIGVKKMTLYKRVVRSGIEKALKPKEVKPLVELRKPTDAEIEGAKLLRQLKSNLKSTQDFFSNVYFDILDNGINDRTSEKIRRNLSANRGKLVGADSIIQRIYCAPEIMKPTRKNHLTWIDIHIAICNKHKQNEDNKKKYTEEDMTHIIGVISNYFNISVDRIKSKSRKRELVLSRAIFSHICHKKVTLAKIGRFLGNRGHATILKAIADNQYELSHEAQTLIHYQNIKNLLEL